MIYFQKELLTLPGEMSDFSQIFVPVPSLPFCIIMVIKLEWTTGGSGSGGLVKDES